MAKIVHSDAAPPGTVHYTFGNVDFDLSGRRSHETDDEVVIANAEAHPWLTVKYPEPEAVAGAFTVQLSPENDILSRVNDTSNDPDAARAAEAAKTGDDSTPTAIDPALDQSDENAVTGGVNETIAADKENN